MFLEARWLIIEISRPLDCTPLGTHHMICRATLACNIIAIGVATGGALNPFRAYGPMIGAGIFASSEFSHLASLPSLVYLAPFFGAILAALIYKILFLPKEGDNKPAPKPQEKETELLNE